MKNSAIVFLFCASIFGGCKSKDVDLREQYVGSYNLTQTETAKGSNGATQTTVTKYNLNIEKGKAADELLLTDESSTFPATLTGNTFEIPPHTFSLNYGGSAVAFREVGAGSFSGGAVSLNTTAGTQIQNIAITFTRTANGNKYK